MIPRQNGHNKETKRLLGIPCGCDNRKEIMGAGSWQNDAIVIAVAILVPLSIYAYWKWGRTVTDE